MIYDVCMYVIMLYMQIIDVIYFFTSLFLEEDDDDK